jgi:Site-specific recombinases, DNA invertase Pin homologs
MAKGKAITVIPATIQKVSGQHVSSMTKRRVAAYARVSTDSEEQLTSYEAQVDYYTKFIQQRTDWEFVTVYTDEGITAVNTKRREGFKQMVADGLAGKFDLLVTKSVSRFARNTVDSLTTVRKLKEKSVEVWFEKENIYTLDSKGELLITIMSSLAQEESRSLSENVTWGQRKRFSDGKVSMPYKQFLGYEKGEDGLPKIVEAEAEIVRMIFRQFTEGKTPSAIAKYLGIQGIRTPSGKKTWQSSTVQSILTNEKYKGDALLQKKFTVDFLTKKMKENQGEVPQYYVQNSHPAIIVPEEFDSVQAEMERRKNLGRPRTCNSPFSSMIVCGKCGGYYGPKVWGSNTKYRRTIWQCNDKYKGEDVCRSPHLNEDDLKERFLTAFNILIGKRKKLLDDCNLACDTLSDCTKIEKEIAERRREMEVVSELSRKAIYENANSAINQTVFTKRNNTYLERYRAAKERVDALEAIRSERLGKALMLKSFIQDIKSQPRLIEEFDEKLWSVSLDKVVVIDDERLAFHFKNGKVIET